MKAEAKAAPAVFTSAGSKLLSQRWYFLAPSSCYSHYSQHWSGERYTHPPEAQPIKELQWSIAGPATTADTVSAHKCSFLRDPEEIPVVPVDRNLPPPSFGNTYKVAVLQIQHINPYKEATREKRHSVNDISKAVLTTYKAKSAKESNPIQTPNDEESQLFSQFIPESVKEEMSEKYESLQDWSLPGAFLHDYQQGGTGATATHLQALLDPMDCGEAGQKLPSCWFLWGGENCIWLQLSAAETTYFIQTPPMRQTIETYSVWNSKP